MIIVDKLLATGWKIEIMHDQKWLVPPDHRRGWAAQWIPVMYNGEKVLIPNYVVN